jgi:D-3-phosphoglycerate dehydrogenase
MKVLITDMRHGSAEEERRVLEPAGVTIDATFCQGEEDLIRRGRGAFAFLVSYAAVTRRVMNQLPELKIIVKYGVGLDNVDVEAARELGKIVANMPDYCVDEAACHTLALILAGLRKLFPLAEAAKTGCWIEDPSAEKLNRPTSLAAGIVGLGRIGSRVAGYLRPLVGKILYYDPCLSSAASLPSDWESVDSLPELIERCSILSVHAPLNNTTHNLIDTRTLARANKLVLVNTSRAALIDREALESALVEGRVSFFASDVFWHEPPDYSDPATISFFKRPDVLITPHMAWYSEESEREVRRRAAEEILRFLHGEKPLHSV